MTDSFERFNKFNPYVTINRDVIEAQNNKTSDVDQPYNLVEWIVSTSETFGTPDDYIKNHTLYVKRWYQTKNTTRAVTRHKVVNNYVKFLKEVLLVHDNQEESRYLMNIDWEDTYDMDIAVPYFANRLRQVVLYVVEQREKIKFEKIRNSYRGSTSGVTKYVYDQIIELLNSEKYYLKYGKALPDPVKTAKDLTVTLNEKYDVAEHVVGESLDAVNYEMYTNFDQAVIKILEAFPTVLAEDGDTLTETGDALVPTLPADPSDLSRLSSSYFYNYTTGRDTLNINLHKLWLERYGGGTMFYLSAGEGTEYTLDTLYVPKYHLYNHTNTGVPRVLYSQPTDRLKTLEHMGGFFKNTGISHAYSLNIEYIVDTTSMSAGETQYFSDPQYTGVEASGIQQYEDVSYIKADASNDALHGDIIDAEQFQKFYPYQSMDESNKYPKFGVSKNTDNFDFWKGDQKDVWSNSDIYPVHLTYDYQDPTEQRTKDLLLGSKCVSNWRTDIFGNDYALLKESIRPKLHADPQAPVDNPCRVLDAEFFWDDTTFQRPPYTDNVDGAPSFRCYDLKLYTDYAYGGYFSPYHCTEFVCFEPNHVEYADCPEPFVLSGHKATNDPTILNYWLSLVGGPDANAPKNYDPRVIFDTWPRATTNEFYTNPTDYAGIGGIDDWVWDPVLQAPIQPENVSFSAFLSPQIHHSTTYKHNAVLQSAAGDDDHNGLVIAYVTRPHPSVPTKTQVKMLVAGRTAGGNVPQSRWGICIKDWNGGLSNTAYVALGAALPGWSTTDDTRLGNGTNGQTPGNGWSSGTTAVEVTRNSNMITAKCSYFSPSSATKMTDHTNSPEWLDDRTKFTIDLNSDPAFADFLDPTGYGYSNNSQADSYFNDSAAFAAPPPPVPIDYDIYDFTQCKPQIWKYSVPRNLWYVHPDDEFDAKVAGDGVLVVDKDGCGSYGFDCLGRCLTVPATADCGPPPDPPPDTPGMTFTDAVYMHGKYFLEHCRNNGIDPHTATYQQLSGYYPVAPDRVFGGGYSHWPFPFDNGELFQGQFARTWNNVAGTMPHGFYDMSGQVAIGEYATHEDYFKHVSLYEGQVSSNSFRPYGSMNAWIISPGYTVEIYEKPKFQGDKAILQGPLYMTVPNFYYAGGKSNAFAGAWDPGKKETEPFRPGFGPLGVFLRDMTTWVKRNNVDTTNKLPPTSWHLEMSQSTTPGDYKWRTPAGEIDLDPYKPAIPRTELQKHIQEVYNVQIRAMLAHPSYDPSDVGPPINADPTLRAHIVNLPLPDKQTIGKKPNVSCTHFMDAVITYARWCWLLSVPETEWDIYDTCVIRGLSGVDMYENDGTKIGGTEFEQLRNANDIAYIHSMKVYKT